MENRRINVRAIIYQDGKILAVKHKEKDGSEANYWATPGGGLELCESLADGLTRELIEETNVKPIIGKLLFIQQFYRKNKEQLEFFFLVENSQDYSDIDLTKTSHGMIEIARIEYIDAKEKGILPEFIGNIDIESYITKDLPVEIFNYLDN